VPVGVIHSSWGGTPAEAWTPKAALEGDAELKPILDNWKASVENFPKTKADYETKLAAWKDQSEKDKADGKKNALAPREPAAPEANPHKPSGLFNGMIAPIVPYAIRGAIWYQGEANAGRAAEYRKLFPTMIESWRKAWGSEIPFGFVQLANYMKRSDEPGDSNWALLREAQTMTLKLPKTGMAVIIDVGDEKTIHPKNKQDVGLRLALWAEASVYESGGTASSPLFSSMKISGDKATITFKHANGLVAKDGPLKGFAIAGDDMKFAWADAKIVGSQVVVSSPSVPKPVAVRYAWADNPECNLYSKDGLPASPFRTDDWEHTLFAVGGPAPAAQAAPAATPTPKPSATPKKSRKSSKKNATPAPAGEPLQSEQSSKDLLKKPAADVQEPEKK
jgi:sialate O-acetylesterase